MVLMGYISASDAPRLTRGSGALNASSIFLRGDGRGADRQWIRELNFKNEFKAVIGARRKAISTLGTYRVVHALWPNQVICYVDGPELAKEVETMG